MLRREAVAQIEALSRDEADERPYNDELAAAIMTDDGSPSPEREMNLRWSGSLWNRTAVSRVATMPV
jgi:hypothetical protein